MKEPPTADDYADLHCTGCGGEASPELHECPALWPQRDSKGNSHDLLWY